MTGNFCALKFYAPLAIAAVMLAGCEADDSMPTRPRTAPGNFLAPDAKAKENAEKRALEKPEPNLPGKGGIPSGSDARSKPDRTVAALSDQPKPASKNPLNAILRELGFVGPEDWKAFGHTKGPMDVYTRDPYPNTIPHLPANPGTLPMEGTTPAPGGDWSIDNSWGQGTVLENYPHRPWTEVTVEYKKGEVKHNPLYFYNVQDHLHVKHYIEQFNSDVASKNFKSKWFYLNAAGMPVWVLLEPPEVPHVSSRVQKIERRLPAEGVADWKSNAYEVPWFFISTGLLPAFMALEPPFRQRITANASADPTFQGHLPKEGTVVPAPMPGKLQWDYPFLNPDGTVKPANMIDEPATAPKP